MSVPNNDFYAGPWVLPVGRAANIYLKGQSSTIAPTAAVAAPPQGLYRVSLCLAITTAGNAGNLTLSVLSAGDGGTTVTQSLAAVSVTTLGNIAQDSFICEALTGDISYQVGAIGLSVGSLKYTVRVVVEQLSALT